MAMLDTPALVTRLPQRSEWEYGGHIYGLEPLALPANWLPRTSEVDREAILACHENLSTLPPSTTNKLPPPDAAEIDRLFWFRWITGHQTTFLLWQLLAAILDDAEDSEPDAPALAAQACPLVRGYTLMLLYASSPPREIYERVIRAPMARQHINLSGAWARDYAPIRPLIRGKISLGSGIEADALRRECEINEQVHEGITEKVVPSGISLLQNPKPPGGQWRMHRETLLWLYDGIFLTSRANLSYGEVVVQLARRVHAIVLEINANGLYPLFAPSLHEEPPTLQTPELMDRKQNFTGTLLEILRLAASPVPERYPHAAPSRAALRGRGSA